MSTEAIRLVKEAEDKVKSILADAKTCARQIKDDATKEASQEYKKIKDSAIQEAESIRKEGSEEGKRLAEPILKKGDAEVSKIKGMKDTELKSVVDSVVERIVKNYGNR